MTEKIMARFYDAWELITEKILSWLDVIIINFPNVILACLVFVLSIVLSKKISKISLTLLDRTTLQRSMTVLIAKFIAIVVVLLGLFLILGILNLSKMLNTVLAGVGVAGLAVSFALQGALANTYSGIVLSYITQVKYGDWIETNGYAGTVENIDLRAITLKQIDNNLLYIPNKMVIENPIKNYSTTPKSKVIISCGVGYESDLRWVQELTVNAVVDHFDDVESPEDVQFFWQEFGDSSINYELRFWLKTPSPLKVIEAKSEVIILIREVYKKHTINIPFPIRTLDFPKEITVHQKEKQ